MIFLKQNEINFKNYKEKILLSIDKLSSNYHYFLVDNARDSKISFIGKLSEDPNYINPIEYCKDELKDKLFSEVETYYSLNSFNESFSKKSRFKKDLLKSFTTGYGTIITGSDLLVLDIDTIGEYNELLELTPNIVSRCKFKRVNSDFSYRMHLYYKKPKWFEPSGNIRRIKLRKEKLWISGLNKFKLRYYFSKDVAYLFRNE
ncbi:hypothetical protein EBQ91_04140, partial [bacterium]|nr:hypothetical protein [bacterium]